MSIQFIVVPHIDLFLFILCAEIVLKAEIVKWQWCLSVSWTISTLYITSISVIMHYCFSYYIDYCNVRELLGFVFVIHIAFEVLVTVSRDWTGFGHSARILHDPFSHSSLQNGLGLLVLRKRIQFRTVHLKNYYRVNFKFKNKSFR